MKDVLVVDPELDQALPLDPFGSRPLWASLILGLGGSQPPPDPGYVFLTIDCRPAVGNVTAKICFHDLKATCGTILIEVRVRSAFPGADYSRLQTVPVDLADLAKSGGVIEIGFETFLNAYYVIAGNINDRADIAASHVSITIDRRATPAEHGKDWGWRTENRRTAKQRRDIASKLIDRSMTNLNAPLLDDPLSQPGTPLQCREDAFSRAMEALHREPEPTAENWSLAYIVRAIDRFGETRGGSRMLGYVQDQTPLLSYFASRNHEIVGMQHVIDDDARPDPGRALRSFFMPALCDEADFFNHAHFTAGDIRFPTENLRDQFDIIWSIGANRVMTGEQFVHFAVASLANVKPDGLAVHVFDYAHGVEAADGPALSRHDIERMTALSLSHGNNVAQLQFRHGMPSLASGSVMPFGLVMLRGSLA